MRKAPVAIVAALLAAASAQGPEPPKTELAAPVELAFAGVKLAFPADFEPAAVEGKTMLLRAVKVRGTEPLLQIVLSAFGEAPKTTLADFAKNRSPSRDYRVRGFKMIKSMAVKVSGVDGEVRVLSYRLRGLDTTALGLYFLRPAPGGTGQVGYVLMVEAEKKNGKLTLPALMATMKTIELSDPVSPLAGPFELMDDEIVSEKWGYSLRPLTWWRLIMSPGQNALSMSRLDYTFTLAMAPELHFGTADARGKSLAQCADEATAEIGARLTKLGLTYKPVSRQATKLAGIDGVEIVIRAVTTPPANRPDLSPRTVLVTQRVICEAGRSYGLACWAETDDVKVEQTILDALSAGLKLAAPSTRPAATSAPTTAPATAIRIVPTAPAPTTAPATVKPAMVTPPAAPKTRPAAKTVKPASQKDLDELEKLIP